MTSLWAPSPDEAPECYAAQSDTSPSIGATVCLGTTVRVRELLYPGEAHEAIDDKWLYFICDGKVAAEVYCRAENEDDAVWEINYNPSRFGSLVAGAEQRGLSEGSALNHVGIHFPSDPSRPPAIHRVLLSPVRMTESTMRFLVGKLPPDHSSAEEAVLAQLALTPGVHHLLVPDVHRWSADAHGKWYMPDLERFWRQTLQPARQAEHFIAGTVRAILDEARQADHPTPAGASPSEQRMDAGVPPPPTAAPRARENRLRELLNSGEPEATLVRLDQEESNWRQWAEYAAAYVAHCADSVEAFAVLQAGLEQGGAAASAVVQWAGIVFYCMPDTQTGRQFVNECLEQPDHLVSRLFQREEPEIPAGLTPESEPAGFWTLLTIFKEGARVLLSAQKVDAKFRDNARKVARAGKRVFEQLGLALESDAEPYLRGQRELLAKRLVEQERLVFEEPGGDVNSIHRLRLRDLRRQLSEWQRIEQRVLDQQIGYEVRFKRGYEGWVRAVAWPVDAIIKGINLWGAIAKFRAAADSWRQGDPGAIERLGLAGLKLSQYGAEFFGSRGLELIDAFRRHGWSRDAMVRLAFGSAEDQSGRTRLGDLAQGAKKVGAGLAFAASVLETIEDYQDYSRESGNYPYRAHLGREIQIGGAGISAIGAGLTLAAEFGLWTAWAGPWGLIASGIGLVVGVAGAYMASTEQRSSLEDYLENCFLGRNYRCSGEASPPFAGENIRNPDRVAESRILLRILHSFSLSGSARSGRVFVHLGRTHPHAYFEVVVIHGYSLRPTTKLNLEAMQLDLERRSMAGGVLESSDAGLRPSGDGLEPPASVDLPDAQNAYLRARDERVNQTFFGRVVAHSSGEVLRSHGTLSGLTASKHAHEAFLRISTTPQELMYNSQRMSLEEFVEQHAAERVAMKAYARHVFVNPGDHDVDGASDDDPQTRDFSPPGGLWFFIDLQNRQESDAPLDSLDWVEESGAVHYAWHGEHNYWRWTPVGSH